MADLLPSVGHIPIPYVMAYDVRPLITLDEKAQFMKEAAQNNYVLFFEHDPLYECCSIKEMDGKVRFDETFPLSAFTG